MVVKMIYLPPNVNVDIDTYANNFDDFDRFSVIPAVTETSSEFNIMYEKARQRQNELLLMDLDFSDNENEEL